MSFYPIRGDSRSSSPIFSPPLSRALSTDTDSLVGEDFSGPDERPKSRSISIDALSRCLTSLNFDEMEKNAACLERHNKNLKQDIDIAVPSLPSIRSIHVITPLSPSDGFKGANTVPKVQEVQNQEVQRKRKRDEEKFFEKPHDLTERQVSS